MTGSRPKGYGGEAQAIMSGAAMLRAAEYGSRADNLPFISGVRVGVRPAPGQPFVVAAEASAAPWDSARPACADEDPEIFFAHPSDTKTIGQAKRICRQCPRREVCQSSPEAQDDLWGIWGGVDAPERRAARRRRGLPFVVRAAEDQETMSRIIEKREQES